MNQKSHTKARRHEGAKGGERSLADFADLDLHFGRFMARFGGGERVALAAAHLSRAVSRGDICLDLKEAPAGETAWPSLDEWREVLGCSRAVAAADSDAMTPLVLDGAGRLYLRRFFIQEAALAEALLDRATEAVPAAVAEGQEAAAELAVSSRLSILCGGPGTGKTTTVVKILLRLTPPGSPAPRLALAAPTGKAAARLEEAVREGLARAERPDLLAALPRATTLHRLLGVTGGPGFRHNARNPLALDFLVVDEASMVPLPLMASLFDALPSSARVLLLGDRDQLASVDPGSVLADIVDAASRPGAPLRGSLAVLQKNFRFGNDHAIYRLAQAVREGRGADAAGLLATPGNGLGHRATPSPAHLNEALRAAAVDGYGPVLRERDPALALEALGRFRILCAVRQGPWGVEEINRRVAALLCEAGLLRGEGPLFAGMPLLITRNDPQLGLFNGDIGLLLPDPAATEGSERSLLAWFPGDGEAAVLRRFTPAQLPAFEPAFAMTVHKSQGSEFDRVLFILPERESPVVTRELIYTGVTRARSHVELWTDPALFAQGVSRRIERASGLRERLAGRG